MVEEEEEKMQGKKTQNTMLSKNQKEEKIVSSAIGLWMGRLSIDTYIVKREKKNATPDIHKICTFKYIPHSFRFFFSLCLSFFFDVVFFLFPSIRIEIFARDT